MKYRIPFFLLGILMVVCSGVSAQSDKWIDKQYFDNRARAWIVEVTSTSKKTLYCTVTWDGVRTAYSDGMTHNDVGRVISGKFTLVLPPYSGVGAAKSASEGVNQVGDFKHKTICA